MAFTRDWNESAPDGKDNASAGDDSIRNLKVEMSDRLKDMLYGFIAGENSLAQHFQYMQFYEQSSVAQPSAAYGRLYCKAVSGKCELFWHDEDGDEIQLTTGGKLNGAVLANDSVDSAQYAAASIDNEHLAADCVDGTKIADDSIDSEHYAAASIDNEHLGADVMHDAEGGYNQCDVDGTKTKVYTKYLTGTTDADSETAVAHGVTVSKILHVSVIIYDSGISKYSVAEYRSTSSTTQTFTIRYDATNIVLTSLGSTVQGQAYRIKIDYTA